MDPKLITGTLDLLILEVLDAGDNYGYQISQLVLSRSQNQFELKEGSMYPALHRLARQNLLKPYWVEAEQSGAGRRRKYYQLTTLGKTALKKKRQEWEQFSAAVNGVLGSAYALA